MEKRIEEAYAQRPRRWLFEAAVALVVVALLVWSGTAVETAGTTQSGAKIALNILSGIFHPDTGLLFNLTTQGVPYLLLETICIAFLGTVVGAIISIPLAFLSASNLTPRPVAFVGRVIIMAVRTVPAFVYGLMFIRVTGPGAFAGLLTMSLCSVGMVSKMYIEAIEDLDVRVLESLDAAGCTTWQKIRYGILPQLMPNFASTAIYRFDINLRDATVLGLVGDDEHAVLDATENAVDGFGNGTFVDGVAGGQALKFSRTDNSTFNVGSPIIDSRELTFSFWGKDFADGHIFHLLSSVGNEAMFTLSMDGGALKFIVTRYNNMYQYKATNAFTHPTLTDGKWHHIAIVSDFEVTTYSTITHTLYVDGLRTSTLTEYANHFSENGGNQSSYDTGTTFVMGGDLKLSNSVTLNATNMTVDNFRVYDNRMLSAGEIKEIYTAKQ